MRMKKLAVGAVLILLLPPLRHTALAAALALLGAWAQRKRVTALEQRGLPRWVGAALCTFGTAAAAAALFGVLLWSAWTALGQALRTLPDLNSLFALLEGLAKRLPSALEPMGREAVAELERRGAQLPGQLTLWAARTSARILSQVPEKLFFLFLVTLSSFYAAADWPTVAPALTRFLPQEWTEQLRFALTGLGMGLRCWLTLQGRLLAVQFLVLTGGLAALGQPSPGAVAALAAVSDALPLLGTGAILLPMSLLAALRGEAEKAIGLMGLCLLCWLLRTVLEPRMVGREAGLSPFYTLLALYLGLQCGGLAGMVGAGVAASAVGLARRSI